MSETITIKECAKRMDVSVTFVRNAIEQGTMPGAYTKSSDGRRAFVIPRRAFEEFMSTWNRGPSDELITMLIKKISN